MSKKKKKVHINDDTMIVINNIANRLANRFRFGYHDLNDMRQQARLFALEGLEKYDGVRPLENFLWTHVRNRLFNFKRDKYARPTKPCLDCVHMTDNDVDCVKYNNLQECQVYSKWIKRNLQKKNLMNFIDLNGVKDEHEKTMSFSYNLDNIIEHKEILKIINDELPIALRPIFKKLQFGIKLNKSQKNKIQDVLKEILNKHGYTG